MTLTARVVEVKELAERLWFLPPPARTPLADKLHGLGVRVHPELAVLKLEREGPKQMGNHAPSRPVKIDKETGIAFLRGSGNGDLADRIEAATTAEQQAAERDRLAPQIPENLATLEDRIGAVRAEDLEP